MLVTAPDVSVVIPTRNEEENALPIAEAVIREMEATGLSFDVIFIDNASQDRTVELLSGLCARDPRVRLIVNTRDFGQMRSPTHAIFQASGRAIINMCADFQDPPELIGEFVRRWQAGADIVLGVRASEENSVGLSAARGSAYWFFEKFGDYPVIPNATGFGLYTRRVVREIERLKEPEPFFRGMLVETGFHIETIAYPRPPRAGGKSNNNFFALLDFTLSGIAGSSKRLVRVPFYLGVLGAMMAVLMLVGGLIAFVLGKPIAGWLIASVVQAEIALLFVFLGLVGDQVRLISERSRQTPLVIERERINFPDDA
ncbi:glycosyltransferase family 2 protein [Sphingomonas sp. Mn802worker]|uniref:glycosyltransferase family 2 protein n=1 Tax=Sphingomonas sp. Mn802worker TaxID=629773 RepID=UPI00037598E5|nr:glycosyltransferase family 2 protein [Sphingomonas sp. Mn802worker]